jgi:hypothetical protein
MGGQGSVPARNVAGTETRPPGCDLWWSLGGSVSHRPRTIDNLPIIRNTAGAETRPPGCDSWWSLGGSVSSPTATCQKCPEVMRGNLVKACVGPYFFLVVVFFVVFFDGAVLELFF